MARTFGTKNQPKEEVFQARKRHININSLVRLLLGHPGNVPGTNRVCPRDKVGLSHGQTQVFSLLYTVEASLSLGQTRFVPGTFRGRRAAERVYVLKVYVPFSFPSLGADIPADIRARTSVKTSKSWKKKHFGTDTPRGRPRRNFGLENFGLFFRSLEYMRGIYSHSREYRKIFLRNHFRHIFAKFLREFIWCEHRRANTGKLLANYLCIGSVPGGIFELFGGLQLQLSFFIALQLLFPCSFS